MIQYYKEEKRYPALLFLDIYMNNQDGVETARILRSLGYEGGIILPLLLRNMPWQAMR